MEYEYSNTSCYTFCQRNILNISKLNTKIYNAFRIFINYLSYIDFCINCINHKLKTVVKNL